MKLSYGIRKNAPAKSHASLAKAAFTILIVAVFLLGSPVFAYADDPGDSYAPFEAATGSGSGGGSEDTVPATPSAEEGAEPDPAEGGAGDSAATGSGSGGGSEDTVPATHSAEEGAGPDPAEGGAGDSAGLGSEQDAQQETEDTTNDYLVPEGSAYIEGEEDTIYYNTAEKNAIQQAVDAAITKAKNDAVIVVNNGTYVGGINISKPAETAGTGGGEGAPASLDSLKIVAADALTRGEDNTIEGYTAGSAGGAAVEGDINIDGINVLLAGLYLSLKDTIKAGNADNFTYYGTALDDYTEIELEAIADKVEIDTGAGNDDLDVSIRQKPSAVFTIGPEGFEADGKTPTDGAKDIIKGAIEGALSGEDSRLDVDIDLGEGNDKLELGLINSTGFDLTESTDTSEYDGVKVNLDVSAADISMKGGAGSDNITVSGGSKLGLATVFIGPLLNCVIDELAAITDRPGTTINIEGQAGDDTITVDTTTAFSSYRGVDVSLDGGEGCDRLHITGKLSEDGEISGDSSKIDMVALAEIALLGDSVSISKLEKSLSVKAANIEAYTDNLENKISVENLTSDTVFESFKNYKLDNPQNFVNLSGLNTFLASLIIMGKNIVIGTINTPHINIVIKSQDSGLNAAGSVTINGEVRGKNILVFAQNSDSHAFGIVENDLNDDEGLEVEASFFDIVSDVFVKIAAGAKLIATKIVSVLASSVQTKPLIPTLEDITSKLGEEYTDAANINFVAVKVGSATISVLGEIAAAAVNLLAETIVKVSAMGDNLAAFGMPLAVGVVVAEAGIKTSGNSKIKAETGGISLTSKSDVRLTTSSRSGLLPFTLGVSAVVNDSYVDVGGSTSLEAKGDILLSAAGYTRVVTEATGPKTTTGSPTTEPAGSSGGFFAISVVIQNVHAAIKDNASARSTEGSIDLSSTAFEYVVNNATSNPDDGGNSFSLENLISKVTGILGSAKTPASEGSGGQKSTGALDWIIGKLNGSGTGVTDVVNDGTSGATATYIYAQS